MICDKSSAAAQGYTRGEEPQQETGERHGGKSLGTKRTLQGQKKKIVVAKTKEGGKGAHFDGWRS